MGKRDFRERRGAGARGRDQPPWPSIIRPVPPREMWATTAVRRWILVTVPRLMANASSTVWPRRSPRSRGLDEHAARAQVARAAQAAARPGQQHVDGGAGAMARRESSFHWAGLVVVLDGCNLRPRLPQLCMPATPVGSADCARHVMSRALRYPCALFLEPQVASVPTHPARDAARARARRRVRFRRRRADGAARARGRAAARGFPVSRRHRAPAVRHQEPGVDPPLRAAGRGAPARARRQVPGRRLQHGLGRGARRPCRRIRAGAGARRGRARAPRPRARRRARGASRWSRPRARCAAAPTRRPSGGAGPGAVVAARACPLFVALAEEGWTDGPVVEAVVAPLPRRPVRRRRRSRSPTRWCSAARTSRCSRRRSAGCSAGGWRSWIPPKPRRPPWSGCSTGAGLRRPADRAATGSVRLLATDSAERFARVGGTFLGRPLRRPTSRSWTSEDAGAAQAPEARRREQRRRQDRRRRGSRR